MKKLIAVSGLLTGILTFCLPVSVLAAAQELTIDHPKVKEVILVQNEFTASLMAQPEILGTAVGKDPDDEAVLVIYVNSEAKNQGEVIRALPPTLRGKRVRPEITEPFKALGKPAGGSKSAPVSHTAKQTPPIQMGTSGGWSFDLANGYCCGGTLGSLIQVKDKQYILSNYHVFEADIVKGGNLRVAADGDPIIQPGLIDVNCKATGAQAVGSLKTIHSLPGSNVDCSVAETSSIMVSSSILEIGPISSQTVAAAIGQLVKKSGRTTGLTRSSVAALNATISVAYDNECAGGIAFTKTFFGQIVVSNRGSRFLAGGDSGSLMVEDVASSPHAVGLLYAGSSSTAIANPIDEVLSFVGDALKGTATMVGN